MGCGARWDCLTTRKGGLGFAALAVHLCRRHLCRRLSAPSPRSVRSLPRLQPNSGLPEFGHVLTGRSRINPTSAGGIGRGIQEDSRLLGPPPPPPPPTRGGGGGSNPPAPAAAPPPAGTKKKNNDGREAHGR